MYVKSELHIIRQIIRIAMKIAVNTPFDVISIFQKETRTVPPLI